MRTVRCSGRRGRLSAGGVCLGGGAVYPGGCLSGGMIHVNETPLNETI